METKISKALIKKAEKIIGDDTGYIEDLETLIESAQYSVYFDWINNICDTELIKEDIHYLVHFYSNGSHEAYYKMLIEWLLMNKYSDKNDIENFLEHKKFYLSNQKQPTIKQ